MSATNDGQGGRPAKPGTALPKRGKGPTRRNPTHRQFINLTDYDADEFVLPASDDKGHSAKASFRYPTSMEREVSVIMQSGIFPFRETSDLFRWCLFEGMKALHALEQIPNSVLSQAEAVVKIGREVVYQSTFKNTFDVMAEAIEGARAAGALVEIRRLYAEVMAALQGMPPGFWRGHYIAEVRRRFGHLVGDVPQPTSEPGPGPLGVVGGTDSAPPPAAAETSTTPAAAPAGGRRRRLSGVPTTEGEADDMPVTRARDAG